MKLRKGFTLVELIVVIAILAVLAVIAVPMLAGWVGKAKTESHNANIKVASTACNTAIAAVNVDASTTFVAEFNGILGNQLVTQASGSSPYTIKFKDDSANITITVTAGVCTAS
jgi:type IV pilus assembly protein PilA